MGLRGPIVGLINVTDLRLERADVRPVGLKGGGTHEQRAICGQRLSNTRRPALQRCMIVRWRERKQGSRPKGTKSCRTRVPTFKLIHGLRKLV